MFISTTEIYQISLNNDEINFLEILKLDGHLIDCLIFSQNIEDDSEEQLLVHKILAAAKLELNQYVMINHQKFPQLKLSSFDSNNFPNLNHVIVFGLDANQFGLNTISPKYQFFKLGKMEIVLVDDVSTLLGDSRKKAMLWNEMKKMFEIV